MEQVKNPSTILQIIVVFFIMLKIPYTYLTL